MGWSLFMEEPGDHQLSLPYGVLAGLAVEDRLVWQLARTLKHAEFDFFGSRLDRFRSHFTTDSILDIEAIQIANASTALSASDRLCLVKECSSLDRLQMSTQHISALAQARFLFCQHVLELLLDYDVKLFASMIPTEQIGTTYFSGLRKDYSFFFERFAMFLTEQVAGTVGMLVLDASRHTGVHIQLSAITDYFEKTTKGRLISAVIVPEPLMSNQTLATINQAAALVARALSYGIRIAGMTVARRHDLDLFVRLCNQMRLSFLSKEGRKDWSLIFLDDVRTMREITGSV